MIMLSTLRFRFFYSVNHIQLLRLSVNLNIKETFKDVARTRKPGYFTAPLWITQRTENELIERKIRPTVSNTNSEVCFSSDEVVQIQGKPVDQNLRYNTVSKFTDLMVDRKILDNLALMGIEKMTPIQRHAISLLQIDCDQVDTTKSNPVGAFDLMAAAKTGSGKTLAYLIPILNRLLSNYPNDSMDTLLKENCINQYPLALILAPTRELVGQIQDETFKLSYRTFARSVSLYGGERPERQVSEIRRGCHIAVATPGRLLDFLDRGLINLQFCRMLIIDEADRLLDMGFEPQLRKILESPHYRMPSTEGNQRQTSLFSATFPKDVALLARDFLRGPACISLNVFSEEESQNLSKIVPVWGEAVRRPTSEDIFQNLKSCVPREIKQQVEWVEMDTPISMLKSLQSILQHIKTSKGHDADPSQTFRMLIFCNTKHTVDDVDSYLHRNGFRVASIHGGKSQQQRGRSVQLFRDGRVELLIATSVAARGLDFPAVTAVINFHLPLGLDEYVHRIGRTGRMGQEGLAITISGPRDFQLGSHPQQVACSICKLVQISGTDIDSISSGFKDAAGWYDKFTIKDFSGNTYSRGSTRPVWSKRVEHKNTSNRYKKY